MRKLLALSVFGMLAACVPHRVAVYHPAPAVYIAPRPVYYAPPRPRVVITPPRVIVAPPRPGVVIYR
jgi:hypothetical protein